VKVEFHPAADAELRAAALFYEDRVPGLGERVFAVLARYVAFFLVHAGVIL
jgi:hypothetical protein